MTNSNPFRVAACASRRNHAEFPLDRPIWRGLKSNCSQPKCRLFPYAKIVKDSVDDVVRHCLTGDQSERIQRSAHVYRDEVAWQPLRGRPLGLKQTLQC